MNPQFPLYIVSKGRWESRFTARALDYNVFKHLRLRRRPDVEVKSGVDEYGMQLVEIDEPDGL